MTPLNIPKKNSSTSLSDMKRFPRVSESRGPEYDEYAAFRSEVPERLPWQSSLLMKKSESTVTEETLPQEFFEKTQPRLKFFLARSCHERALVGTLLLVGVLVVSALVHQAFIAKERIVYFSQRGYDDLAGATALLKSKQYEAALSHFSTAYQSFDQASKEFSWWGGELLEVTRFIPGLSSLSSGRHVVEAGKNFSAAGIPLASLIEGATQSKMAHAQGEKISLLGLLDQSKGPLLEVRRLLSQAEEELSLVLLDDVPREKQEKFLMVKSNLPTFLGLLRGFEKNELVLEDLLGGNGPRTYLFLLQNNHEMRATGGFIGTYALIDINQGVIRRFFVDGIFNPDGQLKENIVPPKPIQKISAGWSLHDSNWFPDFPTSAEKAIFFYEKTGGATVDGVMALTPTVMQKLLTVIRPIPLPQYGVTIDAENFIPILQEQVEVKYDRELNQPKQILADLSRLLIERVFALQDRATVERIAEALVTGLNEKHILLYLRQAESERLIDEAGWSGKILDTPKDYLSVIHSNINGYKTDGVIDERVEHQAKIQDDGSIIDTVTVTRTHRGGDTPYGWWNKVNADYVRVYVPKGSELISSEGTTWEFPSAPLDYAKLGWKRDADVEREEAGMIIDKKSGVRISEDAGKTVFGAWVYVSPKEAVTIRYRYRLPFRIDLTTSASRDAESYSVLVQKQSGSPGSSLHLSLSYPESFRPIWQTEPNLVPYGREWRREADLKTDVFQGIVFGK